MSVSSERKLKILCLHGYRQNADTFYNKLGAFRKIAKKYADLEFISAPLVVPATQNPESCDPEIVDQTEQRGWWFSKPELSFNAHDKTDHCYGFDGSLKVIEDTFEKLGPFDGLLGFSQGAAMAALLCGLQQSNSFQSGAAVHDACFESKILCPSLHVIGESDRIIPLEMSERLVKYFVAPETLVHPGGHFVPAAGPQKASYNTFFQKMLSK